MKYVLPFEEIDCHCLPIVGGKGANLGEMSKAGFPVPPGFCITTTAYRHFMDELDEMNDWLQQLNRLKPEQLDEIRAWGQKIRDHMLSLTLLDPIKASIIEAWPNWEKIRRTQFDQAQPLKICQPLLSRVNRKPS